VGAPITGKVAYVVDPGDRWPFGTTDGGPASRPKVVDMEGVLVAMLRDASAGAHALATLKERGYSDAELRLYPAEQILAYDADFREHRTLAGKVIGAVVDDREAMGDYVDFARRGCSALWVLVPDRDDASAVVRVLADEHAVFVWYHGHGRIEAIPMAEGPTRA
jgi:hypothetical protein